MPRDYAKKKKPRKKPSASRSKGKKSVSKGFLFFTFVLLLGLVALLVYLKLYASKSSDHTAGKKAISASVKANKYSSNKSGKTSTKPQQSVEVTKEGVPFYKTHQEMMNKTVEIPIEDLRLPEDSHPYVYLMPCGSFRDKQRAEELKAQIALVGYESAINHVVVKLEDWYRVELGPYKSKRKTESIRHRLQDNGLNFCKIWPQRK